MALPNSNRNVTLPGSVRDFVERQATLPLENLFEDSDPPFYPYCEYWRRAVAGMLLSGRIAPKHDGFPNMTDVNRICKEANFDQYLFEATGRFLIAAKIIRPNEKRSRYEPAKFSDAFWNHQLRSLQEAARQGFLELVQRFTPFRVWRPTLAVSSMLDGLVALFATAFAGLAVSRDQAGNVFLEFSKLPSPDLIDRYAPGRPKHWSAQRLAPRMSASAVNTSRTWLPWRHPAHSSGKRMGTCIRFERP